MPYDLNIPGWLNEADLVALEALSASVPPGGKIVEIGAWCGRSTYALASSATTGTQVFTIDPWKWMPKIYGPDLPGGPVKSSSDPRTLFDYFTRNLNNIVAMQGESTSIEWIEGEIDLLFIDGMHQHPWIDNDIATWFPRLASNGVICGDDYSKAFPAVIEASESLAKETGRKISRIGSKIWKLV